MTRMQVNYEEILNEIRTLLGGRRRKRSIYFLDELYEALLKASEEDGVPAYLTLEVLTRRFLDARKQARSKKPKP